MQVHVLGLPHVATTSEQSRCAFTSKAVRICGMLRAHGHRVVLYGVEGSDAALADEFVEVIPKDMFDREYGGLDTTRFQFKYNENGEVYKEFSKRSAHEILKRVSYRDAEAVFCTFGLGHEPATKRLPSNVAVVEPGIGYHCTFAPFRVFESYSWMHFVYGRTQKGSGNGMAYDTVIPQAYELDMFTFKEKKEDYWLYMARINEDKGWRKAAEACAALKQKLIIVGQFSRDDYGKDSLHAIYGMPHVLLMPSVGPQKRGILMGGAKGFFCLTDYIEPFGGVAVEAQLCGTPVISTDWGAFSETVNHGVTGWRTRTFDDILWAMRRINEIRPAECRAWAERRYSTGRVGWMYDEYLRRLADVVCGKGWRTIHERPECLDATLPWAGRAGLDPHLPTSPPDSQSPTPSPASCTHPPCEHPEAEPSRASVLPVAVTRTTPPRTRAPKGHQKSASRGKRHAR